MRLKAIHFDIDIPLFGQHVIIVLGYPESKLVAILDRYDASPALRKSALDGDGRDLVGFMVEDRSTHQYLVYMPELPDGARMDGTLTHELYHVVEYSLHNVGIEHELGVSNEVYAYLLGWLKAEVSSRLWKAIHYQP